MTVFLVGRVAGPPSELGLLRFVSELFTRTFCTFRRELSSCGSICTSADRPQCARELGGLNEPPMIISMTTTGRAQQRYDHRLRDLVRGTGDVTIATDVGVPRSAARGWLREAPMVVVGLDTTSLTTSELQHEILALRRRVRRLTALLRLALTLVRSSGLMLTWRHARPPHAAPAGRPTDRRPAAGVRPSVRSHDH
jgi:hypothetical protein